MPTLVVCAVEAEAAAVVRGLGRCDDDYLGPYPVAVVRDVEVTVLAGGVGPAAAACAAATGLALGSYDLVVSAGVAGGFGVPIAAVLVGSRAVAADLGAVTADGFARIDTLGFGDGAFDSDVAEDVAELLREAGTEPVVGDILTVSTVTGTPERVAELATAGVIGEAMEGFGVATAADVNGTSWVELRTVSNAVGDRASWDLPAALQALTAAARVVLA